MAMVVQIGADVRSAVKGIEEVSLSLKEQRIILANLQKQYAQLSTQQVKSKIGQELAADIKIASSEVKRLEAGAVSSFGNIGTAASKGFSAVRNIAYLLPGLGLAGIFSLAASGLTSLVSGLLDLNTGFSQSEIAAAQFKSALDGIADSAEALKKKLDLQDDIAKLTAQLSGLRGQDLNIADLANRSKSAQTIITNEEKVTQALNRSRDAAEDLARQMLEAGTASSKFKDIVLSFPDALTIPKTLIGDLPKREEAFVNQYIDVLKKLEDSKKRSADAQSLIGKNSLQTQVEQQQKQDEINKKALADQEKFVSSTISKGKALADFFKGRAIVPTFTIFDTKQDQLKKALDVINKFEAGKLEIIYRGIELPGIEEQIIKSVRDNLKRANEKLTLSSVLNEKLTLPTASAPQKSFQDLQGQSSKNMEDAAKFLQEQQTRAENLAQTISGTLTPAFQNMFDAISQGENPLQAFFQGLIQSINQLISKLIAAAIQALVLSAITGGTTTFSSAFGKILGFAEGGPIKGPGTSRSDSIPALLSNGEFVMKAAAVSRYGTGFMSSLNAMKFADGGLVSGSGRMLPIGSTGGVVSASQNITVGGQIEIAGRVLKLLLAREDRSQQRNFGNG